MEEAELKVQATDATAYKSGETLNNSNPSGVIKIISTTGDPIINLGQIGFSCQ